MRWRRVLFGIGIAGFILLLASLVQAERGLIFREEYSKAFIRGIQSADPQLDGYYLLQTLREAIRSDKVARFRVEAGYPALWVVGYRPDQYYGPIEVLIDKKAESWGIGSLVRIHDRNRDEELVFFIPDNFRYIALISRKSSVLSVSAPSQPVSEPLSKKMKPTEPTTQPSQPKYVFSDEEVEVPPMREGR